MIRSFLCLALALTISARVAQAFEVNAQLQKVDRQEGVLVFSSGGQTRTATIAADAPILDVDGSKLVGGLQSEKLREGAEAVLSIERVENRPVVKAIRLGKGLGKGLGKSAGKGAAAGSASAATPLPPVDTSGMVALTDLGKDGEYHGFKGGLYPNGASERPADHERAGRALAARVRPLDESGKSDANGKIVLLAMGFSNTSQAFAGFMQVARKDPGLNARLVLVNGAQGGRSAFMIKDPDDGSIGEAYWKTWVPDRLKTEGVTAAEVQAIWLKETDASLSPDVLRAMGVAQYDSPLRQGFPKGAQTLQGELTRIVRAMPRFFPNLKLVYVSSRSYGGWALREGNREPWSYETGFAVKWLIERQLAGDPELNCDAAKGAVRAPWLSWGPYLWANGAIKRKDGFNFVRDDYRENDRMHYSPQGQIKIGNLMLQFFKNDPTSRPWFVAEK